MTVRMRRWWCWFLMVALASGCENGGGGPTLLHGRVVDARSGAPVPGAAVRALLRGSWSGVYHLDMGDVLVSTDDTGSFTVEPGRQVTPRFSIVREGWAPMAAVFGSLHEDPDSPLVLRMQPAGTLRGNIEGADASHVLRLTGPAVPATLRG